MDQPTQTFKRITLLVTTVAAFLAPFMAAAINIALPAIRTEFKLDTNLLGWVATAYLLATAAFVIPFGKAGDIYGRKKVFTCGIVVYSLTSLLCAIAPSAISLIVFRFLQGIGATMLFSTSVAILTAVFPAQERGSVLGINVAATYSGLSLGPFLGGLLTQQLGWRSIFFINVVIGILLLIGVLWKMDGEWVEAQGETFDWIGALLSGAMLVAIMLGFPRLPSGIGGGLIASGIVLLFVFVWWEQRVPSPLVNVVFFRTNRGFAFSNLAALINYSATYAISFLLSLYLQYLQGLSPRDAGFVLIAQPFVMAVCSPIAGKLSDRIEARLLASTGMGILVAGLLLCASFQAQTSLIFIITTLMLLGFGFALFSSPNTHAVMSAVERRDYGIASAMLAAMRSTGQALSLGLTMMIFTLHNIGNVQMNPEYYPAFQQSVRTAFLVFAALCFGGVFASFARGKRL